MSELTEFELCKKIAKIEGINNPNAYGAYNPLTDKALCFDLMVKYNVLLSRFGDKFRGSIDWCDDEYTYDILDKNPQRAICLAIIAKHND